MEEKCTRMVPLDAISIAETQTRERIRQSVVDEYAAMLGEGVEFDPGLVIADGQKLHLACGHHRYHAHQKAGKTEMRCEVRPGEVWDAIELGIKDNQRHKGALLTQADKRTAVRIVLKHQPGMSDRAIADLCEVTNKTVASVRGDLLSTEEIPQLNSRVGRDGRSRKIATGGNGESASNLKPSFGEALSW